MARKLTKPVLIIPDVHGRMFWIDAVNRYEKEIASGKMEVVFLGDYLDVYGFEVTEGRAVNSKQAVELFEEIIDFKKEHLKNVHLLLGNHDMHYYSNVYAKNIYLCRYDHTNGKHICKLFQENKELFQLAWDCKIGDTLVLFTHAGVLKSWVDEQFRGNKIKQPNKEFLNNILESPDKEAILTLAHAGSYRGGWGRESGSVIWADVHEHIDGWNVEKWPERTVQYVYKENIYQVFGHTLSFPGNPFDTDYSGFDKPYITDHFAMLDARQAFMMNTEGEIKAISEI
jgi:hypothetical protein